MTQNSDFPLEVLEKAKDMALKMVGEPVEISSDGTLSLDGLTIGMIDSYSLKMDDTGVEASVSIEWDIHAR